MTNNRNADSIFHAAVEIEQENERAAFLNGACGKDSECRAEVEKLLAAHEDAGSFMRDEGGASPTIDHSPVTERAGTIIGRYKLLQQIGEGGFGVVYMAEQKEPVRRKVALKIIKAGMDTKEVVARFEAERQALAMMDHPNIAKVLDGGATDTGRPYFVMELVKGVPITEFCDENKLDARQRLALFRVVCRAIQHAHQKGVIHRDIKPSNVLVTLHDGDPVPKVIDFGVAKAISQQLTEKTMFTAFGQMIGTPQYMSPEQAEMSGLDVDTRSDIYSLGVLLYELLTGTTPLDPRQLRETAFRELQRMIREDEPPRPSVRLTTLGELTASIAANRSMAPDKLGAVIRGDLDWIVMKALEKHRERRYDSANAMAADVERFLDEKPVEARPPSIGYRFRKYARRNKVALLTTGAVVVALLAGLAGTTWQAIRATREREIARQERETAQRNEAAVTAVLNFLVEDVFSQANPLIQQQRDVSLLEILQRIPADSSDRFPETPLAEASLRHYLGLICRSVGLYEESRSHLRRALEIRSEELGERHMETARTKVELAHTLWYRPFESYYKLQDTEKDLREADRLCTEAKEVFESSLGLRHEETLQSMVVLAMLKSYQEQEEQAMALWREAQQRGVSEIARNTNDPLDLRNSAWVLIQGDDIGRNNELDEYVGRNYRRARSELKDLHPHRLFWTIWYGMVLMMHGKLDEAAPLLEATYERRLQVLGEDDWFTWLGAKTLAGLRVRQGRRDDAIELLQSMRKARPADSTQSLNLGVLLLTRDAAGDRESWLELAGEILDAHEDTDHPVYAYDAIMLALAVPPQNEAEKAMQQRAIDLARRVSQWVHQRPLLADFPQFMRSYFPLALAVAEFRGGDRETSQMLLSDVESGASPFSRALALAYRAVIANGLGRTEQAESSLAESKQAAAEAPPEETSVSYQVFWNRPFLLDLATREAMQNDPVAVQTAE